MKADRFGNFIGNGRWHVNYDVVDFHEYPQITSSVCESNTTESVYVSYVNKDNGKNVRVRFSHHMSNAQEFGDVLDSLATDDEILFHLGLATREFIPNIKLLVPTNQIKMKDVVNYEIADITMKELYALGAGADISQYKGKVAKNSNYLITGDKIEEYKETRTDRLGRRFYVGKFVYTRIK